MENFNVCELLGIILVSLGFYAFCWGIARILNRKFGIQFTLPRKFPRPETQVKIRLTFYSPSDGWHANFYKDRVHCYGIVTNLNKEDATDGDEFEASIFAGPDRNCGFYRLYVRE